MSEFAGSLKERIQILHMASAQSDIGTQLGGWELFARCLAAITPDGIGAGAEAEAQALSAMPRFRVTIRRREGVKVGMRVRWGKRTMLIRQLIDDPRTPDRTMLRCEEVRV